MEGLTGTLSSTGELTGTLDGPIVRGYSAYEIAVQEGFEGTAEEWLLSLAGEQGVQGPAGPAGYTPVKGVDYFTEADKASLIADRQGRVSSLDVTPLAFANIIESIGCPVYVNNVGSYPAFNLSETGWYIFARITAPEGVADISSAVVSGAEDYVIGYGCVDVAVLFGVASASQALTINWGSVTETFVFKSTDLAVRNLDYRTTFYVYDIADYTTWTYAMTTDASFAADKAYYTEQDGEYTLAEVTAGDAVPANTYYNHSKVTFEGMTRNVSYRCNALIDCPIEIVLPVIPDDGYGAWIEIQMQYKETYSTTLIKRDEDVQIGTTTTQAQTAGMNTIDLHYVCANGKKLWTLINTHTNIPT